MRAESSATWTSGEPVSLGTRLNSSMIFAESMDMMFSLVMRSLQERAGSAPHRATRRLGMEREKAGGIVAAKPLAGQGRSADEQPFRPQAAGRVDASEAE